MPLRPPRIVWLLAAALLLGGCEEHVTGVLGTDRGYSLYGVLRPEADTQYVRIFPISGRLERGAPEPLAAQLTSTDLETGETLVWAESLRVGADGEPAHFFYAPFRAAYGRTYRLEVAATTDAPRQTRVEVEVPLQSDLARGEAIRSAPLVVPVYVDGGVPRLLKPKVTFSIAFADAVSPTGVPTLTYRALTFAYDTRVVRRPGRWVVPVNLTEAYHEALATAQRAETYRPAFGVSLVEIHVQLIAANAAWDPPGGTFDAELLVQPGLMSNVENGFGFVGAGYALETRWVPDDDVVEEAGFRPL